MNSDGATAAAPVKNLGWQVTFAGLGVNLALGILYTWSVISKGIPDEWHWSEAGKSWPYAIACLVFCLVMVPAGRMQDKLGPRLVASIGGILVGLGFILASMTTSSVGYMLGFGLLAGAGIGFAYASATPPAVKWFPAARTGLIAGLVVSGFGLASVYAAPLARWLIHDFGVPTMAFTLGIAFLVIVVALAQFLIPPPKGFKPEGAASATAPSSAAGAGKEDFTPKEMLGTSQFYVLWFLYACGAGAGLMVISKLAKIGELQANIENGAILVVAMAIGNGAGRIVAGMASDKLGRRQTMFGCFLLQAILIFLLSITKEGTILASVPVLCVISALIGANYGANLSLFPSVTKDYYGLKNFGVNYGLVFTAWGVGGFMLALGAGKLYDAFQTFAIAYYGAIGLLVLAAICTFAVKQPHRVSEREPAAEPAVETT
ncbi:MAG TPA: OFA family MFS transporter [Thermoguttaceae bacterium]|nr:OFA family MFS transporter [Thermoguttaceae bacterium]